MGKRTAFFGGGRGFLLDPERKVVYPTPPSAINLVTEAENQEARALIGGTSQVVDSRIGQETHTLTFNYEATSNTLLQLMLGREASTIPSLELPVHEELEVPSDGSYTYEGLTADTRVLATVEGLEGYHLTPVTSAPGPRQFQVVTDGLLFNEEESGKSVGLAIYKTFANVHTIGLDKDAAQIGGGLQASFTLYTGKNLKRQVFIPQLSITSRPSFDVSGEVVAQELQCSVETKAGYDLPYYIAAIG